MHPLNGIPSQLVVCAHIAHALLTNKHKKAHCSATWAQMSIVNLGIYSLDSTGYLSSSPMKIGVVEAELWSVFSQPSKPGVCGRTLHNVTSVTQFHRYQKSEDNVSPRFLHSIRGTKKFWVWVKNLEDYLFESWFCLFLLVWRWIPSRGYRPKDGRHVLSRIAELQSKHTALCWSSSSREGNRYDEHSYILRSAVPVCRYHLITWHVHTLLFKSCLNLLPFSSDGREREVE